MSTTTISLLTCDGCDKEIRCVSGNEHQGWGLLALEVVNGSNQSPRIGRDNNPGDVCPDCTRQIWRAWESLKMRVADRPGVR